MKSCAHVVRRCADRDALLLDRPFLLALVRKGPTRRYVLLRVGNDELLIPQ